MSPIYRFTAARNAVAARAAAGVAVRLLEMRRAKAEQISQNAGILILQREEFCAS